MRIGPRKLLALAGAVAAAVALLALDAYVGTPGLIAGMIAMLLGTSAALLWCLARLAALKRADGRPGQRAVRRGIKRALPTSIEVPEGDEAVLGTTLAELEHTEAAVEALRTALERDPTRAQWRLKLVQFLVARGARNEAQDEVLLLPRPGDSTFDLYPPDFRFEAVRLLADLGVVEDVGALFVQETQSQMAARKIDNAHVLAEAAVAANPQQVRPGDLLIATLDARGDTDRALALARENASRRIERLAEQRGPVSSPRELDQRTRLLLSGFFYSGSGAVLDWLRGFVGTIKWAPVGEMRIIKFPGGFFDLALRCEESGRLSAQDLVDHYLHITGWKAPPGPPGRYSKIAVVNKNSRRLFRDARASGYLKTCLEGFLQLGERNLDTAEKVRHFSRETVARALDAVATDADADVVLVDQAVTAWHLEMAPFAPPSTFVIVHRDPRDQFAEVREVVSKPGRSRRQRSASGFAEAYRGNREKAEEHIPRMLQDQGHRVVRVSFEDFVLDHEREADRLTDALGFDGRVVGKARFHPDESRKNIGKYRSLLSDADIALLERELPEFLHPRV